MRVLLLGPTGNLGLRCIPALIAHGHILTVFVRNPSKLRSLISTELLDRMNAVVVGDATDSAALKKALIDHDIEAIIDVAGNQVLPWHEYVLPKIAKAIADAALAVGKERGRPLRIWVTSGLFIMKIPGKDWTVQDHMPTLAMAQHDATRAVIEEFPTADLKWSIIAVSAMTPQDPKQGLFQPLEAPQKHDLLAKATTLPAWRTSWIESIPIIGPFFYAIYIGLVYYRTEYEAMADFLAEDLAIGGEEWIGKKVAVIKKGR
ncbi:hypothetical protein DL95DRAFT_383840 [Leptodontidium sp. 2 PMI_412]|nr:hypothetical protein BKA61DRAFT_674207 [Leptodontidium sp. MPI-SDFR-AT-0119]KAH9220022.1 hypothetical protein DL95DRAFT_383840 [Leptodontidium sp. 2 PMI_412]